MVRHVVMHGPGHDLQKGPIERRWQTSSVRRPGACWMQMIEINSGSEDLNEFRVGVTSLRQSGLIRCQIPRNDMRKRTGPWERTEIPAASKISGGIYHSRLVEVRVPTHRVFGAGARAVATVTIGLRIDNVAAQSYKGSILSFELQRDWGYFKTAAYPGLIALIIVLMGLNAT